MNILVPLFHMSVLLEKKKSLTVDEKGMAVDQKSEKI